MVPAFPATCPLSRVMEVILRWPPLTRKSWLVEPPVNVIEKPPDVMFTVRVEPMVTAEVKVIVQAAPNVTVPPSATSLLKVVKVHGEMTVPAECRRGAVWPAAVGRTATSRNTVTNAIRPHRPGRTLDTDNSNTKTPGGARTEFPL